jgi:hypothetical protein
MAAIISLISEQTIPNLLFIKEFGEEGDEYLFISTATMKGLGKTDALVKAAGLNADRCRELIVPDENDIKGMEAFLIEQFGGQTGFLVNITCGTKPMFLVAFNFFSRPGNRVYYLPIGQNRVRALFPGNSESALKYRLNVREYLFACGISYEPLPPVEYREYKMLKQILKEYRQNGFEPGRVAGLRDNEYKDFFTGGWFEQFVFYRLREQFGLDEGFIELRVKINNFPEPHRAGSDNELDVVFMVDNELYVVEAKVSLGQARLNKTLLYNILFKLSALNRNFGLRSHPRLITLADLSSESGNFRRDLNRKMRVLGIEGIDDRQKVLTGKCFSE